MKHFGKFFRTELQTRHAFEVDGATVIVGHNLRLHILSAGIRRRIHMGDETHGRDLLIQVGGKHGHHITIVVQGHLHVQGLELIPQHLEQVPLLGRRRLGLGLFITLRIHAHIAQESIQNLFHKAYICTKILLFPHFANRLAPAPAFQLLQLQGF